MNDWTPALRVRALRPLFASLTLILFAAPSLMTAQTATVADVFARVRAHDFHPVREGFTYDRHLDTHGVARLDDRDWLVRTLAIRDLVRAGPEAASRIASGLEDGDAQVRYLAAMALGALRAEEAVPALEAALGQDADSAVRSQAAVALRQIGSRESLPELRAVRKEDPSRDVRHQAELAVHAIEKGIAASPELAEAFASLDERAFGRAKVGEPAPDFAAVTAEGEKWRLSDALGEKPVALIWIFADWCPVCHGEFSELIELRQAFEEAGIQPVTIECHDVFPARVMVGKELEPEYWFAEEPFADAYVRKIWWPHLADRGGAAAALYGAQPLAFAVHAEYINRPTVALIDEKGVLRFLYRGTYWGDRPSIKEVLEMMRSGEYEFAAPKRLEPAKK